MLSMLYNQGYCTTQGQFVWFDYHEHQGNLGYTAEITIRHPLTSTDEQLLQENHINDSTDTWDTVNTSSYIVLMTVTLTPSLYESK